ncbi:hydrogen peroxide-inducible genes activator [Pacificimonas sp. WHA3]|uniref:Hydrogen peroxide-inducible genes activator n=1 Tax=Pacificimonas pallii TaxID=2827236 RepID=A0ABS6SEG0_9SPHN|nr:hydrogen peroxide-inducible genes activator [Pacificimonas pallii]MBV7256798.1 hydrogen peroxide-inducible genes activator [Pacificimonas pallii]
MHLPTLKQLQYLVALHDHGHFGRAAEASFVTQSTLSAGLRELETQLDANLVERTRRVVRFTPLGERVAAKARSVLSSAEELAQLAHAESKPLAGELRMGVIPTIAPFLLPKLLPRLRAAFPQLRLFLREEPSAPICEALHKGQVDCVLLALPWACGDVETVRLFDDPFFVAAHQDDQPGAKESVAAGEIDPHKLLLLEDGHCLKEHALSACRRPEFRTEASVIGTSLHTLVQMVDNRLGLTLIPGMAIEAGILKDTNVEARPLAGTDPARQIALVWRTSSPRGDEFRMLAKALIDAGRAAA